MKPVARVIPVLLLRGGGLVKTESFRGGSYIGDPLNAARIFNDSEVDELIVLDISPEAAREGPNFEKLREIASECFMPVCYGGGVRTMAHVERLFSMGFEKVSFNSVTVTDPGLVECASRIYGASSIVASVDVSRKLFGGYEVMIEGGCRGTGLNPVEHAQRLVERGVGEILLTSIEREGSRRGYDLKVTKAVVEAVDVPVIAHGGAGELGHIQSVIKEAGASAAAAGSLFVFHGRLKGVLINYPARAEIKRLLVTTDS